MTAKDKTQRQTDIIGSLLIVISILIAISLASYSSRDELLMNHHQLIDNQMGIAGVFISYFFIKLGIGWFAWGLVPLLLSWGIWIILRKEKKILLRATCYSLCFLFALAALFSIDAIAEGGLALQSGFIPGGFLGGTMGLFLSDWFGVVPAILILVFVLILLITGFFRLRFKTLFSRKDRTPRQKKVRKPGNNSQKIRLFNKKRKSPDPEDSWQENENPAVAPIDPPMNTVDTAQAEAKPLKKIKVKKDKKKIRQKQSDELVIPPFLNADSLDDDKISIVDKRAEQPIKSLPEPENTYDPQDYCLPNLDLLNPSHEYNFEREDELQENAARLTRTLADFKVPGTVKRCVIGPVITRYEVEPDPGIRVSSIANISDDIARVLAAQHIRIVAPIPGTTVVGVEIPNREVETIDLRSVLDSDENRRADHLLDFTIAKTAEGKPYSFNLADMPHLLIAGTTGSGKSVCINAIILSILFSARPDEVKLIMVDPKRVELSIYKALKPYHLISSEDIDEYVVTDQQNAIYILRSATIEMENRLTLMEKAEVRNITEYNELMKDQGRAVMPYIVVIIDELADLMVSAGGKTEVELPIQRLAQKARAVGIHLVLATQRPSVDVITGVIRSNFPARIAFNVRTKTDSRTILDANGAESLLGKGDMLFIPPGSSSPIRLHGAYVGLKEINSVLQHVKSQPIDKKEFILPSSQNSEGSPDGSFNGSRVSDTRDEYFDRAVELAIAHQAASASFFQRRLKIGFSRAGRLLDELEDAGIVGPPSGSKARAVLEGPEYLERLQQREEDENYDEEI